MLSQYCESACQCSEWVGWFLHIHILPFLRLLSTISNVRYFWHYYYTTESPVCQVLLILFFETLDLVLCVLQDEKSCNIFSRCLQVFHRQKNQIIPLLIDSLIISWLVTWLYLDYRVSKFQYLCGFSVLKVIDFFRKGHRLLPQRS